MAWPRGSCRSFKELLCVHVCVQVVQAEFGRPMRPQLFVSRLHWARCRLCARPCWSTESTSMWPSTWFGLDWRSLPAWLVMMVAVVGFVRAGVQHQHHCAASAGGASVAGRWTLRGRQRRHRRAPTTSLGLAPEPAPAPAAQRQPAQRCWRLSVAFSPMCLLLAAKADPCIAQDVALLRVPEPKSKHKPSSSEPEPEPTGFWTVLRAVCNPDGDNQLTLAELLLAHGAGSCLAVQVMRAP